MSPLSAKRPIDGWSEIKIPRARLRVTKLWCAWVARSHTTCPVREWAAAAAAAASRACTTPGNIFAAKVQNALGPVLIARWEDENSPCPTSSLEHNEIVWNPRMFLCAIIHVCARVFCSKVVMGWGRFMAGLTTIAFFNEDEFATLKIQRKRLIEGVMLRSQNFSFVFVGRGLRFLRLIITKLVKIPCKKRLLCHRWRLE